MSRSEYARTLQRRREKARRDVLARERPRDGFDGLTASPTSPRGNQTLDRRRVELAREDYERVLG
ncbi:MAG TPA: hypothetical protein VHH72_00595 [Solirubrobacterales bacterium]|jgi:hypothetical protein|nr:hypothetical protein [Solirubrobacterales bacterium]